MFLVIGADRKRCNNTFCLDKAFSNQTYAYQFSVPPGLHGEDVAYTFSNGPANDVGSDSAAVALQQYITSFASRGDLRFQLSSSTATRLK